MSVDQSLDIKTDTLFDRAVVVLCTSIFAATILLVGGVVLQRQIPDLTVRMFHPMSRYVFIIGVYMGVAVATRNSEHIAIDYVIERIEEGRPLAGRLVRVLNSTLICLFLAICVAATVQATQAGWDTPMTDTDLLTNGQLYLAITTGLAIALLYELLWLKQRVLAAVRGGEVSIDE